MKKAIIMASLLAFSLPALSQPGYNARSMGMAGAYLGMARGAEAGSWNPANLALEDNPGFSVDFLGAGLLLANNGINIKLFNDYFSQEYFDANGSWDEQAKNQILDFIPDGGFTGYSRAQITALAVSYRQFALQISGIANSDLRLPKDLFSIPLTGVATEPTYMDDGWGESVLATEVALSGAHSLPVGGGKLKQFCVGGTVKYLIGHAYASIEDAEAMAVSNQDSVALDGHYRVLQAGLFADNGGTGQGFALDLGAAAQVNEKLSLGLTLANIIGILRFGSGEESQGSFYFHQPGLNIDEFDNFEDYMDSVVVQSDTTRPVSGIRYSPPRALMLSGTYRLHKKVTLELDYQQGLNRTAGGTTTPRVALGAEIRQIGFLPLRLGYSAGGVQGMTFAFGFGFDLKHYLLDFAISNYHGLFNHSKGISFALSQRLVF